MKHTIKEAIKLSNAHKKGRVIQRRKNTRWDWEDVEDFNEDYILEEEYDYRVQQYFRLPTVEEFKSLTQAFAKTDNDLKLRTFLDEKSGNKLHFYLNEVWCEGKESGYVKYFDGFYVLSTEDMFNRSVRLVSDEPFEGGIKFGNVWWKPENEEGFYTWQEAIEKFG